MESHHIDKCLKRFLKLIFCVVGSNSPYQVDDFLNVLLDAVEHEDFTNNTCVRVGGPTGETVFSRLKDADFERIKAAFYLNLKGVFSLLKRLLRNRKVGLAFDITDEPFYGKVQGLWIHPYQPVRGSTGCFKYLTVSCIERDNKFILGNLPVMVGADIVRLISELVEQAREFVHADLLLFDRGFDSYELIEALQNAGLRYQLLWKKHKWTTDLFKTMKPGEIREVNRVGTYSKNKSKHKVKARFVLIKKYRRYAGVKAYDWVFATNTRHKSQHFYVDKYRKRWNIETVFRVLDTIQIKTTSKNEVIRYFINTFCCLVYNLWKLSRVLECPVTLKNFVAKVIEYLRTIFIPHFHLPDG